MMAWLGEVAVATLPQADKFRYKLPRVKTKTPAGAGVFVESMLLIIRQ
jgi:hypothetical protein